MGVQMLSDLKQEFYKFFHPVGRKTNPILLDLELRYIFYTMIWPVSFLRFVTFSIFHRVFGKLFHSCECMAVLGDGWASLCQFQKRSNLKREVR